MYFVLSRYILYSYAYSHDDGRISNQLCFIFVSPQGTKPELQVCTFRPLAMMFPLQLISLFSLNTFFSPPLKMMYAGSKLNLVNEIQATKVFEIRSVEELTEEWLKEKLELFQ